MNFVVYNGSFHFRTSSKAEVSERQGKSSALWPRLELPAFGTERTPGPATPRFRPQLAIYFRLVPHSAFPVPPPEAGAAETATLRRTP